METCAISVQSCLFHFMGIEPSATHHPHRGEGTIQVITGEVKLTYNVGQLLQLISHCILQKIPQLQESYGQQGINHSTQDSDQVLTCCVKMVQQISYDKKWRIWWNKKGLQPAASIHSWRHSHRGRWLKQCIFLTSNASDDFTKSSFHKISCLRRTQGFIMLGHNSWYYWIPRIRNLVKTVIHQCLTCYRFKAKQQQLMS